MTNAEKPLALLAVETADEARCDVLDQLGKITPVWKVAQEAKDKAEEDLLDGQAAARQKFPDTAYDEATSHGLNQLIDDHTRKLGRYRALDSRKRSLQDKAKKMTEEVLRLLGEMREPGIWAAGTGKGPNGWKDLPLRTLTGGPSPDKDAEKQDWLTRELEEAGYHTIGEFLKGRARLIAAAIEDTDLAADTVYAVDAAVYRFLERRNLQAQWPIDKPAGAQLDLSDLASDDGPSLLDSVSPEPGTPAKPKKGKKARPETPAAAEDVDDEGDTPAGRTVHEDDIPPPLLGPDLYDAATAGRKGTAFSKAKQAAGQRVAAMMQEWPKVFEQTLADDEERPAPEVIARFGEVYGSSPAAMFQRCWYAFHTGKPLPQSPVSEGTTELFFECALALSDDLAHKAIKDGWLIESQDEEVFGGLCARIRSLPPEKIDLAMKHAGEVSDNFRGAINAGVWFPPEPASQAKAAAAEPDAEIVEPAAEKPAKKPSKKTGKKAAKS